MKIKEYCLTPQLSIGFEIAGHKIVDKNEDLSIFHEVPPNGFPENSYLYIKHDAKGDKIFNIRNFGIPQNRVLAWESNIVDLYHFSYPSPIVKDSLDAINHEPLTFYQQFTATKQGHIIIDMPKSVSERIKRVPAGGCWIDIPDYNLQNKTFNAYRRLKPYSFAPIMSNAKKDIIIHPTEDRILTPREAGILQGFPASYKLTEDSYQQIADSIPPIIGYHIGRELI